jgi:hypothetical protein
MTFWVAKMVENCPQNRRYMPVEFAVKCRHNEDAGLK